MGREERIPRRNRAGSKKSDKWRRAAPFSEKVPGLFQRAAKSVSGFSGRPERKRSVFRRRKQKSATKLLSFRGNAVLQKAAYSRIPFAATASRLKEEQIPPLTNIPGEISLSPDAAAKAQTSVAKRHKTQRISLSPPRRKKTFSTNDKVSRKMDGTSEFPRRRPRFSFFIRLLRGKVRFPDF